MKKVTPRQLATQAAKLDKQMKQAYKELESARRSLEYTRESWQQLPAALAEARQELIDADADAAAALAELTKPLESYEYSSRYYSRSHQGPRRYASPKAQRAWDAERQAGYKRSHLESLESDFAKGETAYHAEAIRDVEEAESKLATLRGMADNLQARAAEVMGRELTRADLDALKAGQAVDAPETVTIPARDVTPLHFDGKFTSYAVIADNLAAMLAKVKAFAIGGTVYPADHVKQWAKLEKGQQLTVTIGPAQIIIRSNSSRMTLNAQKETPKGITPAALAFITE